MHHVRAAIARGDTTAPREIEESITIAQAEACRHVFLKPTFEEARRAASDPGSGQRPLAGLAVSVKDLFDVRGEATAAGSVALAGSPPAAQDAPAVARLRAAGAAILGRTNMTEFAYSGVGANPHFDTPWNPADRATRRIPGGSSSGAAVSVATGAAFVGLGSDTRGSIRTPAALCGVVGFKNTARLVPTDGCVPLSTTLDTVCAMTRSVPDAILVHELLSGTTIPRADVPMSGYRLAVARNVMLDALEAPVARAFERAIKALRDAGAAVEEVDLPAIDDIGPMQAIGGFGAAESYAWHRQLLARAGDRYDPRVRKRVEGGAAMKAYEYLELFGARAAAMAKLQASLRGFDAVLSPTVPLVAPPFAQVAPGAERDDEFFRVNALLLRNTSIVNMVDGCAISIPCHAPDELPVGLMIWQGALHDAAVLNVAAQAEATLQKTRA
ncbi:amidase [Ramlibacter sp. PS4R-6]|uniref:amidase n=1 Tax=Ramlibacter sp. PS4R-6 TaxID=3133438 RepID=UPI0030A3AA44